VDADARTTVQSSSMTVAPVDYIIEGGMTLWFNYFGCSATHHEVSYVAHNG
jgi:hypothetical protein